MSATAMTTTASTMEATASSTMKTH